jgi:hypothetical protein
MQTGLFICPQAASPAQRVTPLKLPNPVFRCTAPQTTSSATNGDIRKRNWPNGQGCTGITWAGWSEGSERTP